MSDVVDAELLEELKSVLRRDLKLGAAARVPDDMPLIGGEMDLDSLDVLLIVSSVEKHFRIKIPNEVVGKTVFQNVATLAKFVQENRQELPADATLKSDPRDIDWLERLPHGPEFRFISRVYEVLPGQHAKGAWDVSGSEPFFRAHFPGRPIVPGVLMIEGLAQIAGLAASTDAAGTLAHVDVKLEAPVVPPASIELSATVSRALHNLRMCEVVASVSGRSVARGAIAINLEQ
jgi:3-hydroxyacyl-[acyl-carrier-protein] dehydratase